MPLGEIGRTAKRPGQLRVTHDRSKTCAGVRAVSGFTADSSTPTKWSSRFTAANGDRPFYAYSTNYLVDLDHAVIVDVEATAPIRQAEGGTAMDMIVRTRERFGLYP